MVSGDRDQLLDALSAGVVSIAKPDDVKGEHKSIPDLLDQIPGVYVRSQSGSAHYTTASIRGSAPSQVNIYIDGVPMNLSSEMAADISTLPISGVERVEVYRGTTPARFSGAPVGGAINIVTKRPETSTASISIGKRSFNSEQYAANVHFPLLGGHMLVALDRDSTDGNFKYTDNMIKTMNDYDWAAAGVPAPWAGTAAGQLPAKRTRMSNRVDKENLLIKWDDRRFLLKFAATDLDRNMPAALSQSNVYNDTGTPLSNRLGHYQDLYSGVGPYNHEQRQVMRKREMIAGWRDTFGAVDAALNFTWLKNTQSWSDPYVATLTPFQAPGAGRAWSEYTTTRKGVSGDLVWRLNEAGSFKHQAELHADWYDEDFDSKLSNLTVSSMNIPSQFSRKKRNVQLQDMITVAPLGGLQLTPVIRNEKLTGPTIGTIWQIPAGKGDIKSKTTGGVSVKKSFENGWQVFGNTGTYIRFPNFYEIYGNGFGVAPGVSSAGTKTPLVPERGRNIDAGFGWQGRLSEDFRGNFRITAFRRKTNTTITLFSTPIGAQYVNGGPAIFKGVELEGNIAWTTRADLQFAVTKQQAYFTGDYSFWGYPATYNTPELRHPGQTVHVRNVPDIVANARLNMRFFNNALSAFIEANHIGRLYNAGSAQSGTMTFWENPLTTVNVGGSWLAAKTSPNKGLRVSFGMNDVYNKGPKQTRGASAADAWAYRIQYRTVRNDGKPNVSYPYHGRTVYATLNWGW
jgi:outer membrane receptor protein involved in Fe transport